MNLFLLSDVLACNVRWLAIAQGEIAKPYTPTTDEQALLDAFRDLTPEAQGLLMTEIHKLLTVQLAATRANPFPTRENR